MKYDIIYSKRKTLCLQVKKNGEVVVRAPLGTSEIRIKDFVQKHSEWIAKKVEATKNFLTPIDTLDKSEIDKLKAFAREIIPSRVEYYATILNVTYKKISINTAKGRFGSCSSKGTLNFSCNLMRYPYEAVDYVVLHEVAHLIELNHSKKFWAIIEKHMPDYKERKKLLKGR